MQGVTTGMGIGLDGKIWARVAEGVVPYASHSRTPTARSVQNRRERDETAPGRGLPPTWLPKEAKAEWRRVTPSLVT